MRQRRRRILESIGVLGVTAFAGCSSTDNTAPETEPESGPTDTSTQGTPTEPPTDSEPPSTQAGKLAAADGDTNDRFGTAVAVSGDGSTAIIGARRDNDYAGSAYIFSGTGGEWTQQIKITGNDGESHSHFGSAVAISGDGSTAVIGTDDYGANVAYVFSGAGDSWTQNAKFTLDDAHPESGFGDAVAVSGDGSTAIIGAGGTNDNTGSAYVYSGAGGQWTQHTKLTADDAAPEANFGSAVAMSDDGSTAIVGASSDKNTNIESAGSAYIFSRMGESWSQDAKLAPDNGDPEDHFGSAVAMSGDGSTVIVADPFDDVSDNVEVGSAYIFSSAGGSWGQEAKLAAATDAGNKFGSDVAMTRDGSTVVIGDRTDDGEKDGSVYVFSAAGNSWSQENKLTANDDDTGDFFGCSVAVSRYGSTAVIGADADEDPNGWLSGSAYVFN